MDRGRYTEMVFIDLKKAVDTVDNEILLEKLKKYGIVGPENTWFASDLSNKMKLCKVMVCPERYHLRSAARFLSSSSTVSDLY